MEPDTQSLTRWEISPGGDVISLGFVDSSGEARTIRLTLNQVGALAMTLPGLIGKALQTRYGDQTLRYAYPLESWAIEQSTDPAQGMVTLRLPFVSRSRGSSRTSLAKLWWPSTRRPFVQAN